VPVDPVELHLPDYFDYIKHPMDLQTVFTKLKNNEYSTDLTMFVKDIRQIFMNAITYNEPITEVYNHAIILSNIFETHYKKSSLPICFPLGLGRSSRWQGVPLGWKRCEQYFFLF